MSLKIPDYLCKISLRKVNNVPVPASTKKPYVLKRSFIRIIQNQLIFILRFLANR